MISQQQMQELLQKYLGNLVTKEEIRRFITYYYMLGQEEMEIKFNMNFLRNDTKIEFLTNYMFNNIKGMTDELANDLRQQFEEGILNMESSQEIAKRIKNIMDITEIRARTIARTEIVTIMNESKYDAAKETGLDLVKQWSTHEDERTCPKCSKLDGQIRELDEFFEVDGEKKFLPGFHINCRCSFLTIQREDIE